ncbi:hypothetical protein [Jiangella asiatica]|uniref:DUF3137 domain-containing protein n=1 Tax=Jiangella asiatica TaxID=2530372 RepID=A0A4R5DAT9_9ACTN|nr:hypothetical protein [Jiangella asiatica]TDE07363.1 hypothetical protein E1269_19980 [Jiangella asiatica]
MEALVVLLFAALAGAVVVGVRISQYTARGRGAALHEAARAHGWRVTADGGSRTLRWSGPPFRPGSGAARTVVSGEHRGREFVAFEYVDEAKPTPHAKTAIPHRFMVVTMTLPAAVPELSVIRRDPVESVLTRALDVPMLDVGDDEFSARSAVTSTDPLFATTVLQPLVVDHLKRQPRWNWRFDGATMLAWDKGRLEPDRLTARLTAMAELLDRVPAEAWRHTAS